LAGFANAASGAVVAIDDLSPLLVAGQPVADASFLPGPPGISFTSLDLDDDGVADLQLRTDNYLYPALYTGKQIVFQGLNGGGVVNRTAASDIYTDAAVFAAGETIAGELRTSFSLAMDNDHPRELDGAGLFVGFQTAAGNFGYLTIDADRAADTLQIVGGAYESTGGTIVAGAAPIPEPATTSLALLALGAVGLAERRRRRT
jgi:hypothetical protein